MDDQPVRVVRLGMVGFGRVARALARMLINEAAGLRQERGVEMVVTGLTTGRSGSLMDERGIDLAQALARAERGEAHGPATHAALFAATCSADVIVETLPLDPFNATAAIDVTRAAIEHGRSVVSANKGPVAHALPELRALANRRGVAYRFESAVADGMPIFSLITHGLPGAGVTGFTGLLNSTSNVVLDAMAGGASLAAAVLQAQASGITEKDPSHDLEGWDAAVKLAALSAAVWNQPLDPSSVSREPVDATTAQRARTALTGGRRLVSLAELRPGPTGSAASVRLVEIGPDHPFYALTGTSLGLQITSRLLCPVTVCSERPTLSDTAYGLLADLVTLPACAPASFLLRETLPSDLPAFYVHQLDPEATAMAAFPSRDAGTFSAHWAKVLADPTVVKKTVLVDGQVAGNVVCFVQEGERLVGYWLGREFWSRGIATWALHAFLEELPYRPLLAHVAVHNTASQRVLLRSGFRVIGQQQADDVLEVVLRLDEGGTPVA